MSDTTPPKKIIYDRDDVGNTDRLVDLFGDVIRYVPEWKRWVQWQDGRWHINRNAEVTKYAKRVTDEMKKEIWDIKEADDRKDFIKFIHRSRGVRSLGAMIYLASTLESLHVNPLSFDSNPLVLNLKNGMLDLKRCKLIPYDKEQFCTKQIPIEYDEKATCPRFQDFMSFCMGGNTELINYMYRVMGYTITGLTNERKFFIHYGSGRNGKSLWLKILEALLGPYSCRVDFETFASKNPGQSRFNMGPIIGARAILTSELERGRQLSEALIKTLTGDEPITVERKYEDPITFQPIGKPHIVANYRPKIQGRDPAIWGRVDLVPWEVVVPANKVDPFLYDKLLGELPGILNMVLWGYSEWSAMGLRSPAAVVEATETYHEDEDTLGTFFGDVCLINLPGEPQIYKVLNTPLYTAYTEWAEKNGERRLSSNVLGRMLKERGFKPTHFNAGRGWLGIGLKSDVGSYEVAALKPVVEQLDLMS